jgi:hypothetical protein
MFDFKLILLLIAVTFFVVGIWGYNRHRKFMKDTIEINGISRSARVNMPLEKKNFYAQLVYFDCPFTKEKRSIIGDIAYETASNGVGKPVKVYVSTIPPHHAKLKRSTPLLVGLVCVIFGLFWLLVAIAYATRAT